MSAYYDLLEKPDIRQTGEQQPFMPVLYLKELLNGKNF